MEALIILDDPAFQKREYPYIELPKEFRNAVYSETLYNYHFKHVVLNCKGTLGLCYYLRLSVQVLKHKKAWKKLFKKISDEDINPYFNMQCYPEILKHKPEYANETMFWFPETDTDKRIEILKQAIEETK